MAHVALTATLPEPDCLWLEKIEEKWVPNQFDSTSHTQIETHSTHGHFSASAIVRKTKDFLLFSTHRPFHGSSPGNVKPTHAPPKKSIFCSTVHARYDPGLRLFDNLAPLSHSLRTPLLRDILTISTLFRHVVTPTMYLASMNFKTVHKVPSCFQDAPVKGALKHIGFCQKLAVQILWNVSPE